MTTFEVALVMTWVVIAVVDVGLFVWCLSLRAQIRKLGHWCDRDYFS